MKFRCIFASSLLALGALFIYESNAFVALNPASQRHPGVAIVHSFPSLAFQKSTPPSSSSSALHASLFVLPSSVAAAAGSLFRIIPTEVWTCLLPPLLLGLWKSEYTVSLGYGLATSLTAAVVFKTLLTVSTVTPWMLAHALAMVFYGTRLTLFLVTRNVLSKNIQAQMQRIEARAEAKPGGKWSRLPFIFNCALLFYGLAAPLFCTVRLAVATSSATLIRATTPLDSAWSATNVLFAALVGMEWFGFGLAAWADVYKTMIKRICGEDHLVTTGIFSWIRHANYTGEIIGWTANALIGLVGAATFQLAGVWPTSSNAVVANASAAVLARLLMSTIVGWAGIVFVLLRATANLEVKQKERHSAKVAYDEWIKSKSWSGWMLPSKKEKALAAADQAEHEIQMDDVEEDMGSGI
jgi:steroid 5-alpha reductase family enzyme